METAQKDLLELKYQELDDELVKQIDATPLRGMFPEGWICQIESQFFFIPLEEGPPVFTPGYARWNGTGKESEWVGYVSSSWMRNWDSIFPERLRDSRRIVRVGPSIDKCNWTPKKGVSSVMPGVFPPGVLICDHSGRVYFYPERVLYFSFPRSNLKKTDWSISDQATCVEFVPSCLRCLHFPADLRHYDRRVDIKEDRLTERLIGSEVLRIVALLVVIFLILGILCQLRGVQ